MANTTNYNWETPDDTDLVKDGAAAIRTLGNSIDTTTKALNPETTLGDIAYRSSTSNTNTRLPIGSNGQILGVSAGVPAWINNDQGDITEVQAGVGISVASGTGPIPIITNSSTDLITTAGDLLYGTAADTVARLGIGTAGQVLKVNSGATAPEWGAAASSAKNYSLINSGGTSLSGSSTSITGISAKDSLLVVVIGASCTAGSIEIQMTINSDTAANYTNQQNSIAAAGSYSTNNFTGGGGYSNGTVIEIGRMSDVAGSVVNSSVFINGANSAGDKVYQVVGGGSPAGNDSQRLYWGAGVWENSSTVSSIQIKASGGTFDAGTVYIWGSA